MDPRARKAGGYLPDVFEYNYAYMPVEVNAAAFGLSRDELYEQMKSYNAFSRRYPSLISSPSRVESAERILCLPIYNGLAKHDVERIYQIITAVAAQGRTAQKNEHGVNNGISVNR